MTASSDDRISQLRNLLESDPHDAFCMYGIAMEYSNSGATTEAIAWFDKTIETDPAYLYAWYHKASCQMKADNAEEAIKTLEEGIRNAKQMGDQHANDEMQALLNSVQRS